MSACCLGNFGEVFKGMLDTDNEVAVKSVQGRTLAICINSANKQHYTI